MAAGHETFHWSEAKAFLERHRDDGLVPATDGRSFENEHLRLAPPLVFPIPAGCSGIDDYLDTLPAQPGRHTLVLMQAGAVSLGLFERGEEVATKSFRRYVVRGRGRSQSTHLAVKGKSRYGSRLRLQNARRLVEETNEKLQEWEASHGPSHHVFHSAPVRLWPTLFEAHTPPPFEADGPLVRIPLDLPRPTSALVRRTYKALCYGRLERLDSA